MIEIYSRLVYTSIVFESILCESILLVYMKKMLPNEIESWRNSLFMPWSHIGCEGRQLPHGQWNFPKSSQPTARSKNVPRNHLIFSGCKLAACGQPTASSENILSWRWTGCQLSASQKVHIWMQRKPKFLSMQTRNVMLVLPPNVKKACNALHLNANKECNACPASQCKEGM